MQPRRLARALLAAFALLGACAGVRSARDHAHAEVRREHCAWNKCPTEPRIVHLGEGCYLADQRVYDCTTDVLPAGALSCLETPPDGIALMAAIPRSSRELHVVSLEPMAPELFFPLPPIIVTSSHRCRSHTPAPAHHAALRRRPGPIRAPALHDRRRRHLGHRRGS